MRLVAIRLLLGIHVVHPLVIATVNQHTLLHVHAQIQSFETIDDLKGSPGDYALTIKEIPSSLVTYSDLDPLLSEARSIEFEWTDNAEKGLIGRATASFLVPLQTPAHGISISYKHDRNLIVELIEMSRIGSRQSRIVARRFAQVPWTQEGSPRLTTEIDLKGNVSSGALEASCDGIEHVEKKRPKGAFVSLSILGWVFVGFIALKGVQAVTGVRFVHAEAIPQQGDADRHPQQFVNGNAVLQSPLSQRDALSSTEPSYSSSEDSLSEAPSFFRPGAHRDSVSGASSSSPEGLAGPPAVERRCPALHQGLSFDEEMERLIHEFQPSVVPLTILCDRTPSTPEQSRRVETTQTGFTEVIEEMGQFAVAPSCPTQNEASASSASLPARAMDVNQQCLAEARDAPGSSEPEHVSVKERDSVVVSNVATDGFIQCAPQNESLVVVNLAALEIGAMTSAHWISAQHSVSKKISPCANGNVQHAISERSDMDCDDTTDIWNAEVTPHDSLRASVGVKRKRFDDASLPKSVGCVDNSFEEVRAKCWLAEHASATSGAWAGDASDIWLRSDDAVEMKSPVPCCKTKTELTPALLAQDLSTHLLSPPQLLHSIGESTKSCPPIRLVDGSSDLLFEPGFDLEQFMMDKHCDGRVRCDGSENCDASEHCDDRDVAEAVLPDENFLNTADPPNSAIRDDLAPAIFTDAVAELALLQSSAAVGRRPPTVALYSPNGVDVDGPMHAYDVSFVAIDGGGGSDASIACCPSIESPLGSECDVEFRKSGDPPLVWSIDSTYCSTLPQHSDCSETTSGDAAKCPTYRLAGGRRFLGQRKVSTSPVEVNTTCETQLVSRASRVSSLRSNLKTRSKLSFEHNHIGCSPVMDDLETTALLSKRSPDPAFEGKEAQRSTKHMSMSTPADELSFAAVDEIANNPGDDSTQASNLRQESNIGDDDSVEVLFETQLDLGAVLPDAVQSESLFAIREKLEAPSWSFKTEDDVTDALAKIPPTTVRIFRKLGLRDIRAKEALRRVRLREKGATAPTKTQVSNYERAPKSIKATLALHAMAVSVGKAPSPKRVSVKRKASSLASDGGVYTFPSPTQYVSKDLKPNASARVSLESSREVSVVPKASAKRRRKQFGSQKKATNVGLSDVS